MVILALSCLALTACSKKDESPAKASDPAPAAKEAKEKKEPSKETEPAGPKLHAEEVSYEVDGLTLKGYLVYDEGVTGPRPGVLVVHEWWGHNDYVRKRARRLAEMGYTAFALDMYGEGKQAAHPDDAKKFSSEVFATAGVAEKRFVAARKLLEGHDTTNPGKTAAIGYCFGGAVVLAMARQGLDLAGVASFHGMLGTKTPAEKGAIKAKIMVAHGAADPFIAAEDVDGFKKEMTAAEAKMEFHAYEGAQHAFTNPGATDVGKKFKLPLAYDETADKDSWAKLEVFLASVFEG